VLDEGTLVLEGVTLAEMVQLVVEVLVDLSGGTVLDEETAEDTEATHPEDLAVKHTQSAHCSLSTVFKSTIAESYIGIPFRTIV